MKNSLRIVIASIALAATLSASAGCYGSFELTRGLHEWNGQVSDNRFVNWLIFLGFVIVPVYPISLVVDGIALNSVEFWTGSHPAGSGSASVERNADGTATAVVGEREFELRPRPSGAVELYEDDELLGRAAFQADGSLTLYGAEGDVIERVDAETVAERRDRAAP